MEHNDRPKRAATRLMIADVDGALVTKDKILTDRAQAAVRAMRDRGILFAVTSGRPPRGMQMLIEPLRLEQPIAGFNGGAFVRPAPDLTIIEQHAIPDDLPPGVIALIQAHHLDVWVYKGNDWLVRDRDAAHVAREEWTVKFPPTVVPSFDGNLGSVLKIVGISDDLDAVARCEKDAQEQFGESVSAARSQPYYLDVTNHAANKGGVAEWHSARLGIPLENIATIGDQPNDVLMFNKSGLSIAMGNAGDEVKAQAVEVTDSNEDEGFAKAVEKWVLTQ